MRTVNMPCLGGAGPTTQMDCVAQCTRWTAINDGQPIKIYHDRSNWDSSFYANLSASDPQVYLQVAVNLWNSAYGCGNLFEFTTIESEALVVLRYLPEEEAYPGAPCTVIADAECFCDVESDICVRQVDHSGFFSTTRPANVRMLYNDCSRATKTVNSWISTYTHELGHILGMGHVFNQEFPSIMGNRPDRNAPTVLYDFDLDMLERRYPCGCNLVSPLQVFQEATELTKHNSATTCPGCQIQQ